MRDSVDIGCCPAGEPCVPLGSEDYHPRARRECKALIAALRKMYGPEPDGCKLVIKENPHDFGVYLSVEAVFDDTYPEAAEYAWKCEDLPETWDEVGMVGVLKELHPAEFNRRYPDGATIPVGEHGAAILIPPALDPETCEIIEAAS